MSANKSSNLAAVKILHIFNLLFQSFTSAEDKTSPMDTEQTSRRTRGQPQTAPVPEAARSQPSALGSRTAGCAEPPCPQPLLTTHLAGPTGQGQSATRSSTAQLPGIRVLMAQERKAIAI